MTATAPTPSDDIDALPLIPGGPGTLRTTCCYCGTGCGITVTRSSLGRLVLSGDADHPTNRGMLCAKGATLLHAASDRSQRLLHPQVRLDRSQPLGRTTWDAALSHVADIFTRIRLEHGPDAVGFYCSGQMLTEEYYVINKLVKGFLGTNNLDTNSRLCMSSAVAGYTRTLGSDSPPACYEDFECCDTFLVAGANPAWAHPIIWRRVEARRAADAQVRIIVVDPRRTASCAVADLHLQIAPGTDVALHLGLARRIWEIGGIDRAFVDLHTEGWEQLEEAFQEFDLEQTAKICGLAQADIAQAADWLVGDRRFLSLWTMGLNQSAVGVDKNTSLITLSLITGKIGKPGCGPFSLTGQPNAMGGREVGGMATLASGHRLLSDPAHRSEIAAHWGVPSVPAAPGLTAMEMFSAMAEGRLKAAWIVATNPVESLPDAWMAEKALEQCELVVVQDIQSTATAAFAHVVLPAATWLEKTGTMTSSDRRLTLLKPLLVPPGECLPDREIICRFAQKMGFGKSFSYRNDSEIFDEHAALSRGRDCDISGVSHARLDRGSLQWPVPSEGHPGTLRLFTDHQFTTASGRARIASPDFVQRSELPDVDYPLILTTGRLRDQWHTMTRTSSVAMLRDHEPSPCLEIHPDDATRCGLRNQDVVIVTSRRGEVQVQVRVADTIKPGVVFLPMHWGRKLAGERGRTNNLTSPRLDPVSREPDLKLAAVSVRKFKPASRHIVMIGGGASARAFAAMHAAHGLDDRITILGEERHPIYNRVELPLLISGERMFESMVTGTVDDLATLKASFLPGRRVVRIDRTKRQVLDDAGEMHAYDCLIISTGSRPARLYQGPMPRRGVFGLRTKAHAEDMRARVLEHPGLPVVIVGGGVLGLELADALHHIGAAVTVLQRGQRLMSRQIDARASGMLVEEMVRRGIVIRLGTEVEELLGEDSITGVRLKGGEVLPCGLMVFATGTVPNAELAREAVLTCSTGVCVDHRLQTSDPAIFAIGEVADFQGGLAGTTAAAELQAWHLSEFLRGNLHAPYRGPLNSTILKIRNLKLAATGIVEADAQLGMVEVMLEDQELGIYQKCVIQGEKLVGVVMVGETGEFQNYRELIAKGMELGEQRRRLLRGGGATPVISGKLVCSCNQIGAGTIERSIKKQRSEGECTLATICAETRAGTSCGSCRPEIQVLMRV